jgi:hypothetical protein
MPFMFGLQNMAINTFHFVNEHHHHNGRIFFIVLGYNCGPHAQITLCNILVDGHGSITYRASCFMALVIKSDFFHHNTPFDLIIALVDFIG